MADKMYRFIAEDDRYQAFFTPTKDGLKYGCSLYTKPHPKVPKGAYVNYAPLQANSPGHPEAFAMYHNQKWAYIPSEEVPQEIKKFRIFTDSDSFFVSNGILETHGLWMVVGDAKKIEEDVRNFAFSYNLRTVGTGEANTRHLTLIFLLGLFVILAYTGILTRPSWWPF